MSGLKQRFVRSEDGSFVPAMVIVLVPLLAAVGMVTDYSLGVSEKVSMQNALDAASLSIMTMAKDSTKPDRQKALQSAYALNGGAGAATLGDFSITADGTSSMTASASYAMPTNFMGMAGIKTVEIGVASAARKNPALVEATFKIQKVSGYWSKTMTLYGVKFGATAAQPLMTIAYVYNNANTGKGYGTTTISKVTENPSFPNTRSKDVTTQVQQQVCTTKARSWYTDNRKSIPSDAIIENGGQTITACTTDPVNSTGATIDVSQMNMLYLQMDVPSGNPNKLKTNDATTSNRMYIGNGYATAQQKAAKPGDYAPVQAATGKTVDIFSAVPCNETSDQAWEDGGTNPPSPDYTQADFYYSVTGKCNFSQRPSEVALTR